MDGSGGELAGIGCPAGQRVIVNTAQGEIEATVEHRLRPSDRHASLRFDDGSVQHGVALGALRTIYTSRAEIIAHARQRLADRHAADPAGVAAFQGRMARLNAAAKRERQRVDQRALGKSIEYVPPKLVKPAGVSNSAWKLARKKLIAADRANRMTLAEKWRGYQGTPETLEKAVVHHDSIQQLVHNGSLDREPQEWATQIANVYRSIQSDVAVASMSLEARVDNDRAGGDRIAESIRRVRLHHAYTLWREALPSPKQMILDMIVGDAIGYTVAAARYGVGKVKAKRRLIDAIDSWPDCVTRAYRHLTANDVRRLQECA